MIEEQIKQKAKENIRAKTYTEIHNHKEIEVVPSREQCFIDGYHEGFKDCAKSRLNVTTISDCPIKDEWHYPSKGEYPKDEKEVLVYMWGSFYIGSYKQYTDDNNTWHFNDFDEESEQITAWKEIIPPKEIE